MREDARQAAQAWVPDESAAGDVASFLTGFFDAKEAGALRHGGAAVQLWRGLRQASRGGKKLRPMLVMTAHRELGGTDHEAAVVVAAAFELLHTAFLLHDDVIDGDSTRRGTLNLIGEFTRTARDGGAPLPEAAAWGQSAGILAGDLLIHAAQGLVARLDARPDRRRRLLLDLMDDTFTVTAAGELDDVALTGGIGPATLEDVLAMAGRKTAHYTFQAPLRAGAILAGADDGTRTVLDAYGAHAGLAFQLRDDLLGVFGTPEETGKSTVSDLSRATMTPLLAYALRTPYRRQILDTIGGNVHGDADADRARELLVASGARRFVERAIAEHVDAAVALARTPELPAVLGDRLADLSRRAGDRSW